MTLKKPLPLHLFLVLYFIRSFHAGFAQIAKISNDVKERKIVFGNERMTITLDYNHKAAVSKVQLNGQEIINGNGGIYSAIKTKEAAYLTLQLSSQPVVSVINNPIWIFRNYLRRQNFYNK